MNDLLYHALSGALQARVLLPWEQPPAGTAPIVIGTARELLQLIKHVNAPPAEAALASSGATGGTLGLKVVFNYETEAEIGVDIFVNGSSTVGMLKARAAASSGYSTPDITSLRRLSEMGVSLDDARVIGELNPFEGEVFLASLRPGAVRLAPAPAPAAAGSSAAPAAAAGGKIYQLGPNVLYPAADYMYTEEDQSEALVRGGLPFHRPINWVRFGLNMMNQFAGGNAWLGDQNEEGEWPVCYQAFKQAPVPADIAKKIRVTRNPIQAYSNPADIPPQDILTGPMVNDDGVKYKAGKPRYRMILQCRVNKTGFYKDQPGPAGKYFAANATMLRPYCICIYGL
jgi:hypothetical protein